MPEDARVERSRRVIREAALAELAEYGLGDLTIEAVAARAGVARTTVYRHWTDKMALVTDALETLNVQPAGRDAGPPVARIAALLHHLVDALAGSTIGACVPALVGAAAHDSAVRRFLHRYTARRRRALVAAIAAGVEAGDLPDVDAEAAAMALSGALFYRHLLTGRGPTHADVPVLMATVLGVEAGTGAGGRLTSEPVVR